MKLTKRDLWNLMEILAEAAAYHPMDCTDGAEDEYADLEARITREWYGS
jgi:hypothetical protein